MIFCFVQYQETNVFIACTTNSCFRGFLTPLPLFCDYVIHRCSPFLPCKPRPQLVDIHFCENYHQCYWCHNQWQHCLVWSMIRELFLVGLCLPQEYRLVSPSTPDLDRGVRLLHKRCAVSVQKGLLSRFDQVFKWLSRAKKDRKIVRFTNKDLLSNPFSALIAYL